MAKLVLYIFLGMLMGMLTFAVARVPDLNYSSLAPPGYNYTSSLSPPIAYDTTPGVPEFVMASLQNKTDTITAEVSKKYSFCIVDGKKDRQAAFGYSDNAPFLSDCYYSGEMTNRLCGEAEIRFYFASIFRADDLPPNINCNQSHWSLGCEAGYASSMTQEDTSSSKEIPVRDSNPQPCCAGFFCPRGMTCMIPCPLGAYCPLATYNPASGLCDPYGYKLTPGMGNFSCGGANIWADVSTAEQVFCDAGSYCPLPTDKKGCDSGYYCREGSTSQKKCFLFTSCKDGAQKQNLRLYGILSIAILAMILLIVYSCSDLVMSVRDRRKSKAREKAASYAKEHIPAMEKWRMAKEKAAKRAKNFSGQLTRTFSRKQVKNIEERPVLKHKHGGPANNNDVLMYDIPSNSKGDHKSSRSGKGAMPQDHLPPPPIAFAFEQSAHPQDNAARLSETQIFKYAYGQIEKEKVMTSFGMVAEGVMNARQRPPIELAFQNLSMMLKKTGKKILSNVTGKLSPGHITAIMGPSGAGKTTFLNAVAGKATHSKTVGHIYINGVAGQIQSYKKIIGFVPQDDIVHGNLTVEENLWFSAKYRLPTYLPKQERVLILERIIASLGLGAIRNSLVGTVEKRGISGGQRKRVNVGLEMVIEPSLLILDEPTSGLDSTSSRLVLQALRREALEGVNVVLVLHQPSYTLFKMFDTVMFLAKGGRTAYLGPVDEVEDYFAKLGVKVPPRINPPDHFMDVLEGIVTPEGDSNFDPAILPILWMQHEGHEIPEDLRALASQLAARKRGKLTRDKFAQRKSFRQEAWEELKGPLIIWWDTVIQSISTVEDLSGRDTLGFVSQFQLVLLRVFKQRFREARVVAQDYLILLLAGVCLGLLSDVRDKALGSNGYSYTIIAISLLCMISSLRTFSLDKLQFWRESASGINRIAYFLAKDTTDHFDTLVKPFVYLSMFYFFNDPRSSFISNYYVTLALIYCVTGIGYIFAILLQPSTAQLCCVFIPIVTTLLATKSSPVGIVNILANISYAKWALEAYVIANAKRYAGVWLITRCGVLQKLGYELDRLPICLAILIGYGLAARMIALLLLFISNRSRQK